MEQLPGYQERTDLAKEFANEADVKALQDAKDCIFADLTRSVEILKNLRFSNDPTVSLRAIKEHLSLAGLYVGKEQPPGGVTIKILNSQADKVLQAEALMEAAE